MRSPTLRATTWRVSQPEEAAVYDDLRFDRHQPQLRLEQERVGFGWLCDRLACFPSGALVAPPPCS